MGMEKRKNEGENMKSIFFLAIKYIQHYYGKAIILSICLILTILAPLITYFLVNEYQEHLFRRCKNVPLIMGKRGNDYDLLLRSLYYQGQYPGSIYIDTENIAEKVIPLHLAFTAHKLYSEKETSYKKIALVGTTLDYFSFQNLQIKSGRFPTILGEVVIGEKIAQSAQIKVNDYILSEQKNMYDISSSYPLKMKIVGILKTSHSSDDNVAFVDIKVTWIIKGLIHGHKKSNLMIPKAKVHEYSEITPENIDSFHYHGKKEKLPITSLLIFPKNHKEKTILLADYNKTKENKLIQPLDVLQKLMSLIFRIQNVLHAYFILVIFIVILFMILTTLLSIKIRTAEFATFRKMGCSPNMVWGIIAIEFAILCILSTSISLIVAYTCLQIISPEQFLELLF